jgi:hypothetical protein
MTKMADPSKIKKWRTQADRAAKNRVHNVEVMDIYNTEEQRGQSVSIN